MHATENHKYTHRHNHIASTNDPQHTRELKYHSLGFLASHKQTHTNDGGEVNSDGIESEWIVRWAR